MAFFELNVWFRCQGFDKKLCVPIIVYAQPDMHLYLSGNFKSQFM